jgi:8-hydroxy-5-deazaflavin:NADPH oxidoreductase
VTAVTIIGAGNMGAAIAGLVAHGGNTAQILTKDPQKASAAIPAATHGTVGEPITGDMVILALPYGAVEDVLSQYAGVLDGKVIVDITNPVDFATFDSLVVPVGSSAAEVIAETLPGSVVLKAFNTTLAATLASGTVGVESTTVLIAGDDADAKAGLAAVIEAGGLRAVDAGSLRRAHELEALGFLQITLAAGNKTSWTSGFALAK